MGASEHAFLIVAVVVGKAKVYEAHIVIGTGDEYGASPLV